VWLLNLKNEEKNSGRMRGSAGFRGGGGGRLRKCWRSGGLADLAESLAIFVADPSIAKRSVGLEKLSRDQREGWRRLKNEGVKRWKLSLKNQTGVIGGGKFGWGGALEICEKKGTGRR